MKSRNRIKIKSILKNLTLDILRSFTITTQEANRNKTCKKNKMRVVFLMKVGDDFQLSNGREKNGFGVFAVIAYSAGMQ